MEEKLRTVIIILAAGYATRLKPLSDRIPKPLIDINGKTMISRIITSFRDSGFNNFVVLIGYKSELIKKEVLKNRDIQVEFVEQEEPTGMADGILLCLNRINAFHKYIKNYFVTAADIIFTKKELLLMYNLYLNTEADMVLSLMKSQDKEIAKGHGNVKLAIDSNINNDTDTENGLKITDIIEKPEESQILSNFYSLPLYLFNQKLISYLHDTPISIRGEKEFQDAVKKALNSDIDIRGIKIIDPLINSQNVGGYHLTYLRDILTMNKRFISQLLPYLAKFLEEVFPEMLHSLKYFELGQLNAEEFIEEYERYKTEDIAQFNKFMKKYSYYKESSVEIIEPVFLGQNVEFKWAVSLGPNVIIGDSCIIGNSCHLHNTILYDNVILRDKVELQNCIVDKDLTIETSCKANDCFLTQNKNNNLLKIDFNS